MSCERSFHVALWHVAATQASLPSQWRRTCNTLMKIPMNCQPQGPRCGRPWLAASNCVQVLIICPMTGRTDGRMDTDGKCRQRCNFHSVFTSLLHCKNEIIVFGCLVEPQKGGLSGCGHVERRNWAGPVDVEVSTWQHLENCFAVCGPAEGSSC